MAGRQAGRRGQSVGMGRQTLAKSGEWSLDASSKQCDEVQIAVAAAVRRVSVIVNNRCLESDGITARDRPHGKGPKAHPPPAAGSCGYIGRTEARGEG